MKGQGEKKISFFAFTWKMFKVLFCNEFPLSKIIL